MNKDKLNFLKKHEHFFWYLHKDKLHNLSDDVIVEFIFNHGDWNAIKELCQIIGFQKLKEIYTNLQGRKKNNYIPEMYFLLKGLVERYA